MANLISERRLSGGYDSHSHTLVDHRPGGPAVAFSAHPAAWVAVDVAPVKRHHTYEAVGRLESHVAAELHRLELPGGCVLRSCDDKHVAALLWLPGGHRPYAALQRTWDVDGNLTLCLVTAVCGVADFDPSSHAVIALERLDTSATRAESVLPTAEKSRGFFGAAVLATEDGRQCFVLYRFEYRSDLDDFRAAASVREAIGEPVSLRRYHIVKTYGKAP